MKQSPLAALLENREILLASKSPRRQQLLRDLGLDFRIVEREVDESFPPELQRGEIPMYLSKKKADALSTELLKHQILITADTVVWHENLVYNKPSNRSEAIEMLTKLQGSTHTVYTGVTLTGIDKQRTFSDSTEVDFQALQAEEIEFYVDQYKPFDKAGSYGAQDWIGLVGVCALRGSYFNVMGLPVHLLYAELKKF
ncbi:MAG: Maf family nucleotide pyrophosphatase [Flavobacteriales bacterium]